MSRLWGADEARQDALASWRASGDLGVLLLALQTCGDEGAGTDCRVTGESRCRADMGVIRDQKRQSVWDQCVF